MIKTKKTMDCVIIGTRPDIIKSASLIKRINPYIIHTGQHKELADTMLELFEIKPDLDLGLMQDNQTTVDFLTRCTKALSESLKMFPLRRVWVQGDTATAMAGAVAGFLNGLKVMHLEAGLRSFDKRHPFPEETFRKCIDHISDALFAPTLDAVSNLESERLQGHIYFVGNSVVDAIEMMKDKLPNERPIKEKYILVTMHRREAFGKPMENVFEAMKEISKKVKIVLPLHPNPHVRIVAKKAGIDFCEPMDYKDFLWHLKHCYFVMSDAGGVQEEAPSFGKPVLVLRKKTERQLLIEKGFGKLVGWDKDVIIKETNALLEDEKLYKSMCANSNPFGDGKTAEAIVNYLNL